MNEAALDEHLDALDPLRHLREDADDVLVPPQIPTVAHQTIELSFPPLDRPVKLVVDAGPGWYLIYRFYGGLTLVFLKAAEV